MYHVHRSALIRRLAPLLPSVRERAGPAPMILEPSLIAWWELRRRLIEPLFPAVLAVSTFITSGPSATIKFIVVAVAMTLAVAMVKTVAKTAAQAKSVAMAMAMLLAVAAVG